jgi:ornithine decarboxylase
MGERPGIFRNGKQIALAQEPLFDTHPEASLDFETVRAAARREYERPFLILDTAIARAKARRFRAAMPRVQPHYAVKANPDRRVVKALMQEGCGFEIASTAELDLLLELGADAAEVLFSNPVKSRAAIAHAASRGVLWYAADSVDELRRVHEVRPDARIYLRLATTNVGSDWPLSGKFGAGAAEAREIIQTAARLGADLAGVTFHAGSQCRNPENWRAGIEKARTAFDAMAKCGLRPRMLDIGGGFPVRHVRPIPSIEVIGEVVNEAIKAFGPEVQIVAEPGRYLVSDAGYFVCRVIGTAARGGKRWLHLDAGLFGGIIETTEGLKYRIRTERAGPDIPWHVAGPTCDSVDVILRDEPLPSDLQEGDFIYLRNAGAYTTAYASEFNGFPLPEARIFES